MITKEQAHEIAERYVQTESEKAGEEFAVVAEDTLDDPFGWVFFYNTRRYVETGDDMAIAVGNAPIIVTAESGTIHVTGTALPLEHYLSLFRRYGTCHPNQD